MREGEVYKKNGVYREMDLQKKKWLPSRQNSYVICGCLRTEDEVEELQYWCGDAMGHGPELKGHPRRGRDES